MNCRTEKTQIRSALGVPYISRLSRGIAASAKNSEIALVVNTHNIFLIDCGVENRVDVVYCQVLSRTAKTTPMIIAIEDVFADIFPANEAIA